MIPSANYGMIIVMKCRLFAVVLAFFSLPGIARAQSSDTEAQRKTNARAAFVAGLGLQESGKHAEALAKFEAAERQFGAPTHLLHIAQCQALVGKLVDASETYEVLIRKPLGDQPPDAFVEAKEQGKIELAALRPRIPTLKITVKPGASSLQNLQIALDDRRIPTELVDVALPLNPGSYKLTATATGWATPAPVGVEVREHETRTVELSLQQGATLPQLGAGAANTTPAGEPPPYGGEAAVPSSREPTALGLLVGLRPTLIMPMGRLTKSVSLAKYTGAGAGIGVDLFGRVARWFLIGGTLEYAALAEPDGTARGVALPSGAETTTSATYAGVLLGVIPNVDRVSFVGDVGFGGRTISRDMTVSGAGAANGTYSEKHTGGEFSLGVGLSIPAGPLRIVPKAGFGVGSFGRHSCEGPGVTGCPAAEDGTHTMATLNVGVYYDVDFGKKPATAPGKAASAH